MNEAIEIKKIKCLDGLYFSFEMIDFYYKNLYENCLTLHDNNEKLAEILSKCWGFVDSLHRIREIVQALPTISAKEREIKSFLESTQDFEDFRHYIQHLRGELCKDPPNPYPVWGSVSWVDQNDNHMVHTAIIGAQIPGTQYTSCVYDRKENRWVSKVVLGADGKSLNFDFLYNSIQKLKEYIIPKLLEGYSKEIKVQMKVPIFSAKIILGNA